MELGAWSRRFAVLTLFSAVGAAHAQTIFKDGFEDKCAVDADLDRLADCLELTLGTNPADVDSDADGLRDGDEVLGTLDGLDLPALGTDPLRKDLLLEHDWDEDSIEGCGPHSHKPTPSALEALRLQFANAPIPNPDGSFGINVISDVGQGGPLDGGTLLDIPNAQIVGQVGEANYLSHRAANFDPKRLGFFHYVLHVHQYTYQQDSSGQGEILGDDMIVSMQCSMSENGGFFARSTLMHELGHNLGLFHGGGESCNYKPNYNSIMAYGKQRHGRDLDCDLAGDLDLGFSTGTYAPLDENALDEFAGVCGGVAVDWNGGGLATGVSLNINPYGNEIVECSGLKTMLTDFDDWAHITLQVLPGGANSGEATAPQITTCAPVN